MQLSNEVVLRPRFNFEISHPSQVLLKLFAIEKKLQSNFIITQLDEHVYIKFPKEKQHIWSPQLHLEIVENNNHTSTLYGVFGPNPTVWTLFMFLHFVVACLFLGFGIWTYSNWSLGNDFAIQLFLTMLMVVVWFVLYFIGRMGKNAGKDEMHLLHNFMHKTLNKIN